MRRLILGVGLFLAACEPPPPPPGVAAGSDVDGAAMLSYVEFTADRAGTKLVDLARAMPEETYGWRPMEGVRSVGEVFIHIAADNWYGPALMGVPAPEETGITGDGGGMSSYQERDLPKDQIVAELEASFDHLRAAFATTAGDLEAEAQLGGNTVTYGDVWVRLITHLHEHLGQSIAYARSNDVVPPWSR